MSRSLRVAHFTLTIDTYGHLFPGQEIEALSRLQHIFNPTQPDELRATGTDDLRILTNEESQHMAQQSARDKGRDVASQCDEIDSGELQEEPHKPLQIASQDDVMREDASADASSGGGIRTPDTRIMIPLSSDLNPGKQEDSDAGAAHGAAVDHAGAQLDPDLQNVIEKWAELPEAIRAGILAMVRSS